jgi:hypothetical protein
MACGYRLAMRQWERSVRGKVLIILKPICSIHWLNKETEMIFRLGSLINW